MTTKSLPALLLRNPLRRWAPPGAFPALVAAAVLVACGGGGGSTGIASNPPPQSSPTLFASGPITGFGSVIVNGVRFDDSSATITDDSGRALGEAELHLGMQADVDGEDHDGRGAAHSIQVHSAIVGPVGAVDVAGGTINVLDQTVAISATTAFDDAIVGGLQGVTVGEVLAVHAQFDAAAQVYRATRVESDSAAAQFKIRGTVTALDPTAKTLQIGATQIAYDAASGVPATLAVGSVIVARLKTTPLAGVWSAIRIDDGRPHMDDHDEAHLRGIVSAFTSATSFSVDGTPVDASKATFPNGQGVVALGVSVEVEGQLVSGVLVAKSVAVEDAHAGHGQDVELHGTIGALDTAAQTFVLRGSRVSYAGSVVFRDGTLAALVEGLFVEVKGGLSADGTTVVASEIDLKPAD